jgi:pyridoxine 5-phosphate synthase
MPVRLHINVDHVATLRNARGTRYPDPVFAAKLCEQAGADGITAHLREDRRHITDRDVERLRAELDTMLNLEMAATDEMIAIARRIKPDVITLVPERREERTTEGGLDVFGQRAAIEKAVAMAKTEGIKTSLFIAADRKDIDASRELGVDQIELHTGEYCHAESEDELERLRIGAEAAAILGLEVAAGHGLTRHNVIDVAAIEAIEELNIGHAVIADAVLVGIEQAVNDFRAAIDRGIGLR